MDTDPRLSEMLESVIVQARVLKKAQDLYDQLMRNYGAMISMHHPLDEASFWHTNDFFRVLLFQAITTDRAEPVDWAADEMCRVATYDHAKTWWIDSFQASQGITFPTVLEYAHTYENYRSKAYKLVDAMKQIETGKGDDGFGDMMDSLPILGPKFFRRMEKMRFYNYKHFRHVIRETVREHVKALGDKYTYYEDKIVKKVSAMIIDGENYFGMTLEEKTKEWLPRYFKTEEEEVVA